MSSEEKTVSSEGIFQSYTNEYEALFQRHPDLRSVINIGVAGEIIGVLYNEFDLNQITNLEALSQFGVEVDLSEKHINIHTHLLKNDLPGRFGAIISRLSPGEDTYWLEQGISDTLSGLLDINRDYVLMSRRNSKEIKFHLVQKWLNIFPKTILERQALLDRYATKIQAIARGKIERAPAPAPAPAAAPPAPAPAPEPAPEPAPAAAPPAPAAPAREPAPAPNCCTCAFLRNRNSRVTEIIGGVVIGLATWQIMAASGLAVSAVASGGIVAGAVIAAVIIIATVKYIMNKNLKEVSVDLVADGDVASGGVVAGCS